MKVYKFGGASVRDAEGVRNLGGIVERERGDVVVVVSAMGKTTNALERVVEGDSGALGEVRAYHEGICRDLFGEGGVPERAAFFLDELEAAAERLEGDYDAVYDRVVSYGELISTAIVAEYLGVRWLDARACFVTDGRHRNADVDLERTGHRLRQAVEGARVCVVQGFIGSCDDGRPTTLGREGSDYSAAVVAYVLDADSLTIWKDVPGIMNADPKIFPDAVFIPELTYLDAIELAHSGAQIIHPKTIKPLQNKSIPLCVRPFATPDSPGSMIQADTAAPIEVPVLILKRDQTLLSIRPKDFSFVLETRLPGIFALLGDHGLRMNLIQSSAVNLSVCVDASRNLAPLVEHLSREGFMVRYNTEMEILTIRGYTPELLARHNEDAYLLQKTRRTLRVVRKTREQ